MSIFRVHGIDQRGETTRFDVECGSESAARKVAVRHGIEYIARVEATDADHAIDVIHPEVRVESRHSHRKLDRNPVMTIAAGVFLGLLMWTLFVALLAMTFGSPFK
ncbi:MAG: hypothetical protein H6810_08550 [Phycisphaeraceae bacterium]|nr:MAG: hypothetical protein H6810_08550 [Phycisphaeraceae bacterium]